MCQVYSFHKSQLKLNYLIHVKKTRLLCEFKGYPRKLQDNVIVQLHLIIINVRSYFLQYKICVIILLAFTNNISFYMTFNDLCGHISTNEKLAPSKDRIDRKSR